MKTKFEFTLLSQEHSLRKTLAFILFVLCNTSYTQNTYTFTNAGATGRFGPTQTQINTAYSSTNLNGLIVATSGIQSFTLSGGIYRISAYGAQGGTGVFSGGLGAKMEGDFTLTSGTVINILVGQQGELLPIGYNTGGGGGTFVWINGQTLPLIVAGGGGGSGYSNNGVNASVLAAGTSGTGGSGVAGTSGNGANPGGGGWFSAGLNFQGGTCTPKCTGNTPGLTVGGASPTTTILYHGCAGTSDTGDGGFGGGSGANGQCSTSYGGGGGGGYSGGVGQSGSSTGGGGGGSYNAGTNQSNMAGANTGHGMVIIKELCNISLSSITNNGINSICTGNSATLTTNAISNYSWSTGATTSSLVVSPTVTTVYSLAATSVSNCTASAVLTITVNSSLPNLSVSNSATSGSICAGSTVALTASGATTYTWSSGIGNGIAFAPSASSNYTVSSTNGCGTSTAGTSVFINPIPNLSVNSGSICSGTPFVITPSGATSYSYSSPTNTVSPTSGTNYYTVTGSYSTGCLSSIISTVTAFTKPTISVSNGTLCTGNSFTIQPIGTTITSFTVIGNSNIVSPTVTTSYQVIGSNSIGCVSSNTANFSISVYVTPTVSANTGSICSGNSFVLSGSGASSYTYSSGSSVVYPTTTTTYSIMGRTSVGCYATNTAVTTITVHATPTVVVNSGTLCSGSVFTLNPSGANTYTFSGGSNTVAPNFTSNYTVTGTSSAGCLSNGGSIANVSVVPSPTVTVNSGAICVGEPFIFYVSGASFYTFSGGASIVYPSVSTNYTIVGGNPSGCYGTVISSVVVNNLPPVSISSPTGICIGNTATLSVSGASSYTWNTNFNGTDLVITPTTSATYSVIGKDANGCIKTDQKQVLVFNLPSVSINGNGIVCQGTTINLLAGGTALTYTWNTGYIGSVLSIAPATSTVFTVVGSDVNYCSSSASITVIVNPSPQVTASANTTLLCEGNAAILNGAGANSYIWSAGVLNNVSFYPSLSNTYTVTGSGSNGCTSTATIAISVNPLPSINVISSNEHLCPGQTATISANGANTYNWSTGAITSKIIISPTITTNYTVTGTDFNGCTATFVYTQMASECLSLANYANDKSVLIYPNPSSSDFTISLDRLSSEASFKMYNAIGQLILSQKLEKLVSPIDANDLKNGVYFIQILQDDKVISQKKIIKQ